MSRRRQAKVRELIPDPVYGDVLVSALVNRLFTRGKRSLMEKVVYQSLSDVSKKTKKEPVECLKVCLDNIAPKVEVRSRRVGGATYQVPVEVRPRRALSLSIRWLVESARQRQGKTITQKLSDEILDAVSGKGIAVKRKENVHRMAEANQAFSHYRW